MRVHLRQGQLVPPSTLAEGVARHRQLGGEIVRVTRDLKDRNRRARMGDGYNDWQVRASNILAAFRREEKLLGVWIEEQRAGETDEGRLLRRCHDVLKVLESDDALEPSELEVVRELDAHFNAKTLNQLNAKTG